MREKILSEIKRLAAENDGTAPGQTLFHRVTAIRESDWRGRYWARWGDALAEAGYKPNEWVGPIDENVLLEKFVEVARYYGKIPTKSEIDLYRRTNSDIPSEQAYRRRFRTKNELLKRLKDWLSRHAINLEIPIDASLENPSAELETKEADGFVYLLQFGTYYKIGQSDNIERRVKEITVALPQKGKLVHAIRTDDPVGIEAYWHRRFSSTRVNGEWFLLKRADIASFKRRRFQ